MIIMIIMIIIIQAPVRYNMNTALWYYLVATATGTTGKGLLLHTAYEVFFFEGNRGGEGGVYGRTDPTQPTDKQADKQANKQTNLNFPPSLPPSLLPHSVQYMQKIKIKIKIGSMELIYIHIDLGLHGRRRTGWEKRLK